MGEFAANGGMPEGTMGSPKATILNRNQEADEQAMNGADGIASESEDEATEATPEPGANSRRLLNCVFTDLLSKRAEAVTDDDIKTAIKATEDSQLSMTNLMAKQDFASIVHDPREYQLELFEKAKEKNTIAVLDTGSGKTLIAVLLLKHIIEKELIDRELGKPHRLSFFLVDSVTLVYQQSAVLQNNIDQKMDKFCGAMRTDLWSRETWTKHFSENMVIVCTAEVLHQCLLHSFISMRQINLLIFDEAHHAKKDHPYARIVKDFYQKEPDTSKRPKIFGMTASPVDAKADVVKSAKNLETMMDSQIATASDLDLLRQAVARPTEEVWEYDRLELPLETELYKYLHSQYGDISTLEKLFHFSLEASSTLGSWCSDWVWSYGLSEEALPKLEARTSRKFMHNMPMVSSGNPDAEVQRIKRIGEYVKDHDFEDPATRLDLLSPKVRRLHAELLARFEEDPDSKCIVFTEKRHTARVLKDLFVRIGSRRLRPGLLIGVRSGNKHIGTEVSFRDQFMNVLAFRKGDLNCLFATSVAEEGLDISDCNLIVRFDLYTTLIQYIQSRGRARHTSSTFAHMIERDNMIHQSSMEEVRRSEDLMRRFCTSLPADRLLQGSNDTDVLFEKERYRKSCIIQTTGAKLTYPSSLGVLAHYASSLQYESKESSTKVNYHFLRQNDGYLCEAILPEKSPVRGRTGKTSPQKSLAKQSAAFETCLMLRNKGYLDDYFISTYYRKLPAMRNAKLAITSKKCNQYDMILKPKLWEQARGTLPSALYATVISLSSAEGLRRSYQPFVMLTRNPLPNIPTFPLYLEDNIQSDVTCTGIPSKFTVSESDLDYLSEFTLRIFQDVFHKIYEKEPDKFTYWLAPVKEFQSGTDMKTATPQDIIDWDILRFVSENATLQWSSGMPDAFLKNRFVYDRWDGRYRYFTYEIDPSLRPTDTPPLNVTRRRYMDSIMGYCVSLFKNARVRFMETCDWNQPVIRAELVQLRRNFLDKMADDEKDKAKENVDYYICIEPLAISALPASVAVTAFTFPAIISRIESYMIVLEACNKLELKIPPELALEAFTKDSDNTEEHRLEQVQFQRGMGKNYERLEFLGDCFLKMATSISLFAMNPDNDEYDFHVKRMCLVCNKNLFNTAIGLKIYETIRSRSFSRRTWYPEGLNLLQGKSKSKGSSPESKHGLADKTIADVCEALIGASFLSGGDSHKFDMAVNAVSILVNSDDHRVRSWNEYSGLYKLPKYQLKSADAAELDLAKQVEKKLGYKFKYPRILRSAFTHASYPSAWADVPCYQRLEFLGDSLLDMVCVEYLFNQYPDKDPQWLTEHKMAMVSNKFLGAVAVKLGLHPHLRYFSTTLQSQITTYALEIEAVDSEAEGSPDSWTSANDPPKCLPDMVEAYLGAIFVDSNFNLEVVEDFFRRYLKQYFEDMTVYDTFANKHPTTFIHNKLSTDFGCCFYALKAGEMEGIDNVTPRVLAAVIVHNEVVAEGRSSSVRYAKLKASEKALVKLEGLTAAEFREKYKCDCRVTQPVENGS